MKLSLRICLIAALTFASSAIVVRLIWTFAGHTMVVSRVIIVLIILATLGVNALVVYLAIKPSLKKLQSLPVAIAATVVFGGALVGAGIHYIRFVPSPGASAPISVVIASLLLAACISGYVFLLWLVWGTRRRRS